MCLEEHVKEQVSGCRFVFAFYERLHVVSFAFNSASRYLDDLLYIDNLYFEKMISEKSQANFFDTEALSFDLDLSISNGIISSKIYDQGDAFIFFK